jgi:hypothetical protein
MKYMAVFVETYLLQQVLLAASNYVLSLFFFIIVIDFLNYI